MRRYLIATVAALSLFGSASAADVSTIYSGQDWKAYAGEAANGTPTCGVIDIGASQGIAIRWFLGQDHLTLRLTSEDWHLRPGVQAIVHIAFDGNAPWEAHAVGIPTSDGTVMLEANISVEAVQQFITEMQQASVMHVVFTDLPVSGWVGSMRGSSAALDAMTACMGFVSTNFPSQPAPRVSQPAPTPTPAPSQPSGAYRSDDGHIHL